MRRRDEVRPRPAVSLALGAVFDRVAKVPRSICRPGDASPVVMVRGGAGTCRTIALDPRAASPAFDRRRSSPTSLMGRGPVPLRRGGVRGPGICERRVEAGYPPGEAHPGDRYRSASRPLEENALSGLHAPGKLRPVVDAMLPIGRAARPRMEGAERDLRRAHAGPGKSSAGTITAPAVRRGPWE